MTASNGSNEEFIGLIAGVLITTVLIVKWYRSGEVTPDPWEQLVPKGDDQVEQEVCVHCSTPQGPGAHFCPHCGAATGPYNNLMPFEQVFSIGEVLRNGTSGKVRLSPWVTVGYLLVSFSEYLILAPIYWFCLLVKPSGRNKTAVSVETAVDDLKE